MKAIDIRLLMGIFSALWDCKKIFIVIVGGPYLSDSKMVSTKKNILGFTRFRA